MPDIYISSPMFNRFLKEVTRPLTNYSNNIMGQIEGHIIRLFRSTLSEERTRKLDEVTRILKVINDKIEAYQKTVTVPDLNDENILQAQVKLFTELQQLTEDNPLLNQGNTITNPQQALTKTKNIILKYQKMMPLTNNLLNYLSDQIKEDPIATSTLGFRVEHGEINQNIVEISDDFNRLLAHGIRDSYTFSTINYGNSIKKIEYSYYGKNLYRIGECHASISLTFKDDTCRVFVIRKKDPELDHLMLQITKMIQSTDIDSNLTSYLNPIAAPTLKSTQWDTWNNYGHEDSITYYKNVVDPILVSKFYEQLANWDKSKILTVLDVGGGIGRLAQKLLEEAKEQGITVRYLLLEPSKSQCDEAKRKCSEFKNIEYINDTLEGFLAKNPHEIGKINIAISCGGPIHYQVVDKEEAQKNLNRIQELLTPDGTLIAMGRSPVHLNANEFKESGFKVINSVASAHSTDKVNNNPLDLKQCYVCKNIASLVTKNRKSQRPSN